MITDRFWDLTNKPQTKIKLNILKDYLAAWAIIFAKQPWCKKVYYVDCCAGRGKYHDQRQKDIINGSPIVALEIAKAIKLKRGLDMTCFFIERDSKVIKDLKKFTKPFDMKVNFDMIEGDLNNEIDNVLNKIPDGAPIFFFIDPEGIDVKRDSIEKMLAKKNIKEFLITYIQKGVERCLGFAPKTPTETDLPININKKAISNLRKVEDFFGKDWRYLSRNQKENLKKYLEVFIEYNEKAEQKDKLKRRSIDILYNQGRNKYHLIFISRKDEALGIIEDILIKTEVSGTLLARLPYQEKKKFFQGKFDI